MSKNTIIILVVIIAIIIGGIIIFSFLQKEKVIPAGEIVSEGESLKEIAESAKEILSLSAIVLNVDVANNFLIVKPEDQETKIKVILSGETKIKKLDIPEEVKGTLGHGKVFIPTETYVEISDINEGDKILIVTNTNIAGKTEFNDVKLIQVLP